MDLKLEEVDRGPGVACPRSHRAELGFGEDLIARPVQDREELAVRSTLLGRGRRPEPEVIGVHEAEQIAELGVGDLAELKKCRADIRFCHQVQDRHARFDEGHRLLLRALCRERFGVELGVKIIHKLPGVAERLGRNFAFFRFLAQTLAQVVKLALGLGEPLSREHIRPFDRIANFVEDERDSL